MIKKIKELFDLRKYAKENKKRVILLGSLVGIFLLFGFKGLLLFVGGGALYHVLSNRYGLNL